jgi:SAM-dependent methyltransferase
MMSTSNDQVEYWNGPVGERWVREQEAIDAAFATFTAELLSRAGLRPGHRVIDVGCGCGTTSLAAADAVGAGGAVLGVDISSPMLARARERSVGRSNLAYVLADAAAHDFGDVFDAVISRFGVMFFREPARAFAHLRGALRPGGQVMFACWRAVAENEWVHCPYEAAAPHLPPAAPSDPHAPGPFAFADATRVSRILRDAGFTDAEVSPFDADVVLSDSGLESAVHFAMTTGPTARAIRDAGEAAANRVREALSSRFEPLVRDGRVALGGAVWMVRATAP